MEVRYVFVSEHTLYDRETQCAVPDDSPQYLAWVAEGNVADPMPPPPIVYARLSPIDTRVRTTDDQPLEVFRFSSEVKHVYRATFQMTAVDAVSGAARDTEARMVFKRAGASLTQVGATVILANFADTATATWAIIPTVDGTDLVISVKAAAGRTVDWLLVGEIGAYAPEGLTEG